MTTIEKITEHFENNRKPLLLIAKRGVGEFWAEDVVQDAYENCIRYQDKLNELFSFDLYIKRVLLNVIKAYQRDSFPCVEIEEDMWESGDLAEEYRAKGVLKEIISELVSYEELPRTALYLYLIQGETADTVSKITGISIWSIRMLAISFREVIKDKYEIK